MSNSPNNDDRISNLKRYLLQAKERSEEDRAIRYFRDLFPDFDRQDDAQKADGYVKRHFVLELKGAQSKWYAGLFQALVYRSRGLSYSLIVVAAEHFLAIWRVSDIPDSFMRAVEEERGAPSKIGVRLAMRFSSEKKRVLKLAAWYRPELFQTKPNVPELFASDDSYFRKEIHSFEKTLLSGQKVREKITLKNFPKVIKEMSRFFTSPIKAVRGFYSMIYNWDGTCVINPNHQHPGRATLGGSVISDLVPNRIPEFREFVDRYMISEKENTDAFFSDFDKALDAVDKKFRIKNGIFFTDEYLSRFAMWLVKTRIPELGKNYLVVDPACGSGNLVTNWRSPLMLRHKVVSEIQPELLYAVEQRMRGDAWHEGKFTVVPKVRDEEGLNFLTHSAEDYLERLKKELEEKNIRPDKPLAFLCNPPYRGDDDQQADKIDYKIHKTISDEIGNESIGERYCCFLAQMKLICDQARESGLPGKSVLLLFTKTTWLSNRPTFQRVKGSILSGYQELGGILVNSKEFFDLKGRFPVAFTMWQQVPKGKSLDPSRAIPLIDLTWLSKEDLLSVDWNNPTEVDKKCQTIVRDPRTIPIEYPINRGTIREWAKAEGLKRKDFGVSKEEEDLNKRICSGLPSGHPGHEKKSKLGDAKGSFIGFMDNLTPCRIDYDPKGQPWFRLDNNFMDRRRIRCFSGPPDCRGYSPSNLAQADRAFFWFSLAKTFVQCGYPMWVDSQEMWEPRIRPSLQEEVRSLVFSIAFADNDCVQALFPANNPIHGAPEISISNPLSSLNPDSFWNKIMRPNMHLSKHATAKELVHAVERVYECWERELGNRKQIFADFKKPYFIGEGRLTAAAGLVQIKDYARAEDNKKILSAFESLTSCLKKAKEEFFSVINTQKDLNYFGAPSDNIIHFVPPRKQSHSVPYKKAA